MADVTAPQRHFNAGEVSPLLSGRDDLSWYGTAAVLMENMIGLAHGPAARRPGSRFVNWCRGTGPVRLLKFEASVDAAYVVEATDHKFRFWTQMRLVFDAATDVVVEIDTPYGADILRELKTVQSADVMWIFHETLPVHELRRTGETSFELQPFVLSDGPYLAPNISDTTLSPSAATGEGIVITASADVFVPSDVGRTIQITQTKANDDPVPDELVTGWAIITEYTDPQHVVADVHGDFVDSAAVTTWRLGLYGEQLGYPCCGTIHQERLALGSNPKGSFPRVDISRPGAFDSFTPGVNDDMAIAIAIGAASLPIIRELVSMRTLIVLTVTTEFSVGPEGTNEPLTPTNSGAVPVSYEGAANIGAVLAKKSALFVQRTGRAIIELGRSIEADGLRTRDISIRGEHMVEESPIVEQAWANRPWNVVWNTREDGALIGTTYQPDQEVVSWHRHSIGGAGLVLSVETLPRGDGDELWLAVQRAPGGKVAMEVMRFLLRQSDHPARAVHVDSALILDATIETVPLQAQKSGGLYELAATVPVFPAGVAGREITAFYRDGRERNGMIRWRQLDLHVDYITAGGRVAVVTSHDGNEPTTLLRAGDWRLKVTNLTGLTHLEGMTVTIAADGAPVEGKVVKDGIVTLDRPAGFAVVGLPFRSRLWPTRVDAGSQVGSNIGKVRRLRNIAVRVIRSGSFWAGIANGKLEEAPARKRGDPMDRAPPLISRDVRVPIASEVGEEDFFAIETELPTPLVVASVAPARDVGDVG